MLTQVKCGDCMSDWLLSTLNRVCDRLSIANRPVICLINGDDDWPPGSVEPGTLGYISDIKADGRHIMVLNGPRLRLQFGVLPEIGQCAFVRDLIIHELGHVDADSTATHPHGEDFYRSICRFSGVLGIPLPCHPHESKTSPAHPRHWPMLQEAMMLGSYLGWRPDGHFVPARYSQSSSEIRSAKAPSINYRMSDKEQQQPSPFSPALFVALIEAITQTSDETETP